MRRVRNDAWGRVVLGTAVVAMLALLVAGCGGPEKTGGGGGGGKVEAPRPKQPEAEPLGSSATSISLSSPSSYERTWVTRVKDVSLAPASGGGVTCEITGGSDTSGGQYGGVRINVGKVKAVSLDVTFDQPQNVAGVFADLVKDTDRRNRLRWNLLPGGSDQLPSGRTTFVLRPSKESHGLFYVGGPAKQSSINHLQFFLRVQPGATAGFTIHELRVEK